MDPACPLTVISGTLWKEGLSMPAAVPSEGHSSTLSHMPDCPREVIWIPALALPLSSVTLLCVP